MIIQRIGESNPPFGLFRHAHRSSREALRCRNRAVALVPAYGFEMSALLASNRSVGLTRQMDFTAAFESDPLA
jgi:hypothetical protein